VRVCEGLHVCKRVCVGGICTRYRSTRYIAYQWGSTVI
jgi:hypothetical protein